MEEITYSNGMADIMVDRDEVTGAILDIYTYKSDVNNITIKGSWNWIAGKNPLFVHLSDKQKHFYTLLEDRNNGFYNLED